MLTDYHVHLRPDDDDTPPAEYFTPANAERYREAASERGIEELGVSEHVHRFVQALDVWTHPWWRRWAHDDIDEYCAFVREQTDLRLGIEADYVSGREDRMATLLDAAGVGLRGRLGPLPARRGRGHARQRVGRLARGRPREGVGALLRDARRGGAGPACSTSSPTRTS